ncbi:phage tail tape measure protein [Campylobacter sp. RM12920]|uniref:Phage tail tape measure protein n=1 Tax=Campylobacter californiensis TaxID=1032243 RepID=A0ABD4JGN7_9BACT|nr:phage tail tape measure protein [Campylobacter sp. RM12919]MBE2987419.1 phage tail tape measure protein [Campylobacter sp. RM12920]
MSASNEIKIKITIDGDSKDVTLIRNEVNKLGNSINNVDTYANALKSTLGKFAAVGFAINGVSDAFRKSIASVDALANATGRLKLVTKNNEELKALSVQILNVANSARVSFTETTDIYARFANNLKNSAVSSKQMIEVTEAVSKSLIISGASAQSANAALIQLSQGLAADSLRGQELASVMEQTPRLAQAIADGMGVTIGQLRKLAEENKLTTEAVFNALYKQKEVIEKEFGQMPITIGQSMTVLGNNVQNFLGRLNEASGFSKAMTSAMIGLGGAFNAIIPYIGAISNGLLTLISSLAVYKISMAAAAAKNELFKKSLVGGYANSFATSLSNAKTASDYLRVGIGATTAAFGALKVAMMKALPLAGIMLATEAVFRLGSSFIGAKERSEELKKSLELTNEEIKKLTINELNAHMARLVIEQDKLKDSLDKTSDAMHRLEEEIDNEELRDQAFDGLSKGAGVFEGKLSAVSEKIKTIQEQIDALSNPDSVKGQFLQANTFIDKILDDNKNVKTKIDLEDAIKTEVENLTKLSELTGITSQNERSYLNAKEKTLAKIIKLNEEYENFGKEKSQKGIKDFKDNANALKSALKEITEVDFNDIEIKTQRVFDRYNEMLNLGIGKDKANVYLNSSLAKISNEQLGLALKSEQEELSRAQAQAKQNLETVLNLKDREYDLRKRGAELMYDEVAKARELALIEHERANTQYNHLLAQGEITREHYNQAMILEEQLYQKQLFDASSWGQVMQSGLNSLENAMGNFLDYSSDRFLKFGDVAKSVLNEIYKALIREFIISQLIAAVRGVVGGLMSGDASQGLPAGGMPQALNSTAQNANYVSGSGLFAGTGFANRFAGGGVLNSPDLHRYVNSVVSKPTFFAFAKGGVPNIGVMGEKNGGSPEAIMPLTRTKNGDLGVRVQSENAPNNLKIEIINQTREEATVTNVSSRQNLEEQVISIVIGAVRTNKGGMRDMITGGGR